MAWPPPTLPTNRSNATPQTSTHPADHNALALAINDTVGYVQFLDSGLARKGVVVAQSGQSVAAGQVVTLSWSSFSETTFGTSSTLIVPANAGGIYVASLKVNGPVSPANSHGDVIIYLRGEAFAGYIPESKSQISVCAMLGMSPGDGCYVQVYNSTGSSQFFIAAMSLIRVSV